MLELQVAILIFNKTAAGERWKYGKAKSPKIRVRLGQRGFCGTR